MFKAVLTLGAGAMVRGLSQITSLLLAIVAARVLGKEEFGVYAVATVFVLLLQSLMYCGVYDFLVKDRSTDDIADTCYWINFGFSILGAGIILILAPVIATLTHSPAVLDLMIVLAPSALLASTSSWQEALLLRSKRLSAYYWVCAGSEAVSFIIALILLSVGFGLWSFVVYRYLQIITSIIAYFELQRATPHLRWDRDVVRRVFRFSGNLYVSRIVDTLSASGADLLIGIFVNPAAAGAYRLGSRVVTGISAVAYQAAARLCWLRFSSAAHSTPHLRAEWTQHAVLLSVITWPALGGVAILSSTLIPMVMGPGWEDAAFVVSILAVARMVALFDVFLDPLLGVLDRTHVLLKVRAITSLSTILLLVALSPWGSTGAVSAQLIASMLAAVLALRISMTAIGIRIFELPGILGPGIASALTATVCAMMSIHSSSSSFDGVSKIASAILFGVLGWGLALAVIYWLWPQALSLSKLHPAD